MPKLLRTALLILSTFATTGLLAQTNLWEAVPESSFVRNESEKKLISPVAFRALKLDTVGLLALLETAPKEFTLAANTPLVIALPMPDGTTARFAVVNSPMMEPGLQAQFPYIKTFSGRGIDDATATLKMDWTSYGLHVQVLSSVSDAVYIDPYVQGEKTQYMSYYKKNLPYRQHVEVGVLEEQIANLSGLASRTQAGVCLGSNLRTYRLAVACTGEYATAVGAATAAAANNVILTTVNRVNGIYERDLSVRLTLIANNTSILFTNSGSDPFTGNNDADVLINESQTVIDANITSANYDIGHTFSTGAGGLAQSPSVCIGGSKARGVTGSTLPTGDAYDVDFVAHEIGHQFGASHTFNATTVNCGGGNRSASTAVEPGSGITIMGYAGICGASNDLAPHSIPYFHAISQNQIGVYITSGAGSTCGTATSTGNSVPVVSGGADHVVPFSTPFVLTGSATDANNSEVLTYSWEEIDAGVAGNWNSGSKPFFRSFNPTVTPERYFPRMSDLATQTTTIGEILPSSAQTLNFRLTARDNRPNGGGVCSDDVVVTVSGSAGPFDVSSQWGPETWTANGTNTAFITWNVASTNLAPISAANVSILFSTDGGLTFPYVLVSSTPNDGSESIIIPALKTTRGRVMVKAVGKIFFDINDANITVTSSCVAEGATISPSSNVTAFRGSAPLNLALSPQYGSFNPSGTITTDDLYTNLTFRNTATSSCQQAGNQYRYDAYTFSVTTTGSYTFTFNTGAGLVANLYTTSFSNSSTCTNFITSSGTWPGSGAVTLNASVAATLTAGNTYVLTIGTFSATTPASLPASYAMTITGPGTSLVGSTYTNPGGGFNYTYVVVNNATGKIVAIGNPDLTNMSIYPAGQYTVYGLSYSSSISNLNTFVGGSFAALKSQMIANPSTFCADLSKNSVTVNVTGTFPVQFTALKARKHSDRVALDWGTMTEQNNSHFMVQRS
ncbi:MAG: hypothetical protein K0Q66_1387, partial [Chitinophagaceae bacterium]|nr:hypothetical protein [Chitinophagaceae bacterium]